MPDDPDERGLLFFPPNGEWPFTCEEQVADAIEEHEIAPMDILDLAISNEIAGDGPWWSVAVYWSDK